MKRFLQASSLLLAGAMANTAHAANSPKPCAQIPHMDHPHAALTSGDGRALIFLPDPHNGYYRGARFDWSGVVGCYAYKGHAYFGEWFSHYDPELHDAIAGPVEEFRTPEGALGYDAARPGELFVKLGVGTLRKISDAPYLFSDPYPVVDTGRWETKSKKDSVRFVQTLSSPTGVQYRYEKVLSLKQHGSVLTLEHRLTNLGSGHIVTDVYDHDFYMLDGQPTGPGFTLTLPFAPMLATPLAPIAIVEGNSLRYQQDVALKQTAASYITGYGTSAADYRIRLENATVGVEQTGDAPITRLYLWSIHTTICPEAYIHLDLPPGETRTWAIRYRFYEVSKR